MLVKMISRKAVIALVGAAAVCMLTPALFGASATLSFDTPEYGTPDVCPNTPPLFNRPEFGSQTADFIVDPPGCNEGSFGFSNGSDSLLTSSFSTTGAQSNELRFSWVDPSNEDSWARVIAFGVSPQGTVFENPTVHLGVGSSISMDIMVFGTTGFETETPVPGSLEFSLAIRETGTNVPLGVNGGQDGDVEFVGIDSKGGLADANRPNGGTAVSVADGWVNVKWTFTASGVDVSVDGGAAVSKSVVGFTGDGALAAAFDRGTLDSLIIRKPAGDTVKKWFVNVDNIVIDAPGVVDPVPRLPRR